MADDRAARFTLRTAATPMEFARARQLFEEYADSLGFDLCFQNFAEELDCLENMYGPPRGCLLLAVDDTVDQGCVALRDIGGDRCEMKRLYVRDAYRGQGLGRILAQELVARAGALGYTSMLLDTVESMAAARGLYRSLDFAEVAPYYANPLPGVVYMARTLAPASD